MAKKVKVLTAEAAARLAEVRESDLAGPPAASIREAVVAALLDIYLRFVEQRATAGRRSMAWHEVGVLPMRVSSDERTAALEKLAELGYRVDGTGVGW